MNSNITSRCTVWNPKGKVFVDPSLEKSALIVFVEFCSELTLSQKEVDAIFQSKPISIFHLTPNASERLANAIGVEHALWDLAHGEDLLSGRQRRQVFVPELRHCPICMQDGRHSMLFQLPQVARCPVHRCLLEVGCPQCRRAVSTKPQSLAIHHLHCGSCGRNLSAKRRGMRLAGADVHFNRSDFSELRDATDRILQAGESRSPVLWDLSPGMTVMDPALGRMLYAHTIWGVSPPRGGIEEWKSTSFDLPNDEGPRLDRRDVHVMARFMTGEAFIKLAAFIEGQQSELELDLIGPARNAGRTDLTMSAITAAYWQAARVFDVERYLQGQTPAGRAREPEYAPWLPEHPGAMKKVINQAVMELFVRFLVRNRHLRYGVQLVWNEAPAKAAYLVPWRLRCLDPGKVTLDIRIRVTRETIRRLVHRYRDQRLSALPPDARPLEVINSGFPRW